MNRSTDLRAMRALAAAALVLMLAACGGTPSKAPPTVTRAPTPATKPAEAKPEEAAPVVVDEKADPQTRFNQALALMKQKKTKEAEEAFLKLAQDHPDLSGPQTNLGILYGKANKRDVALSAFTKAASNNPQNAAAFNLLGIVAREAGDYPRALQAYERALAIKPDYAAVQLNLGLLLDEYLKRPAEALPHYREYLRLYGKEDLRVLAWMAEIERNQKVAATGARP